MYAPLNLLGRRRPANTHDHTTLAHDVHPEPDTVTFSAAPYAQGLYDPANEHDACGVAFVVDAAGRRSHAIVEAGVTALRNLEHRGAAGSRSTPVTARES